MEIQRQSAYIFFIISLVFFKTEGNLKKCNKHINNLYLCLFHEDNFLIQITNNKKLNNTKHYAKEHKRKC